MGDIISGYYDGWSKEGAIRDISCRLDALELGQKNDAVNPTKDIVKTAANKNCLNCIHESTEADEQPCSDCRVMKWESNDEPIDVKNLTCIGCSAAKCSECIRANSNTTKDYYKTSKQNKDEPKITHSICAKCENHKHLTKNENPCYTCLTQSPIMQYFQRKESQTLVHADEPKDEPKCTDCIGCEVETEMNQAPNCKTFISRKNPKDEQNCADCTTVKCSALGIDRVADCGYYTPRHPTYTSEQWAVFKASRVLGLNYASKDKSGEVFIYDTEPAKGDNAWFGETYYINLDTARDAIFSPLVSWSDAEPFEIPEVAK